MTLPLVIGAVASCVPRTAAQLTVFDPANFQQNLLSAARALEQINNQVRVLQNQVLMIARMDQNLVRLGGTMSPDLQKTLGDISTLLRTGDGIALRLAATQSGYDQLFPKQASALTHDDALRNAKARWDEQYGAFQRTALLQGKIADGIETDTGLLATAMGRSRDAVGALEAVQAGNELTGLNVKQSLALQGLLAAQYRAETTKRARDLAAEEDARQRFKTFLGTGTAYTASR
jgi:P-type conjugative transfer protein TrbJ